MKAKKVLFVVDMQNDFVSEGGSLALPYDTTDLVKKIEGFASTFPGVVVATVDTHDADSVEFSDFNPKGFPKHCVKGTWGHSIVDCLC